MTKTMRKASILLCIFLSGVFFVACAVQSRENPHDLDYSSSTILVNRHYYAHRQQTLPASTPHYPAHPTIRVPINPQRIVTFGVADLDILYYMGLQDRVVGRAGMPGVPAHIDNAFPFVTLTQLNNNVPGVVRVSGTAGTGEPGSARPHEPNYDTIIRLQPDLIIIEARQRNEGDGHFQRLSRIAPTVDFGLRNDNILEDTKLNIKDFGRIFPDYSQKADTALDMILKRIASTHVLATQSNFRALLVLRDNDNYSLHGHMGRWSIVFNELGLRPAISSLGSAGHGVELTDSLLLNNASNIEIIFYVNRNSNDSNTDSIINHALFSSVNAVAHNRVFQLNNSWYFALGGATNFVNQISEIEAHLASQEV